MVTGYYEINECVMSLSASLLSMFARGKKNHGALAGGCASLSATAIRDFRAPASAGNSVITPSTPLPAMNAASSTVGSEKDDAINRELAIVHMDDHYPVPSAFSLLNQVLDEYQKSFGETWRSAKEDPTQTWPYLVQALNKFQDPAEAHKLLKIQRELDETKIILHKTIDSVLERGEKLDSLVEKSSDLSMASQMSVASDSPVHSSSSDDLAAFLDAELDSASDASSDSSLPSEEEDDTEASNHESKRRKFEHLETVEEVEIEEASSSKGECEHPGSFGNICFVCGQKLEETGVSFRYIHKEMRLNQDEISRLRDSDMGFLQRQRKLYLVLDLDHTLLNSTILRDLKPEEEYLNRHTHSLQDVSGGSLFKMEFMHMMTKLRPFVHSFLKEASEMFVMYIYTMGDRPYARQMAKLLDPKGEYFGDRIISRDDGTVRHQKSLDVVLGQESAVLILDDTENAWPNHKDNLIVIERYHFFASSCRQFDHKYKSLSELKSDESEPDGALATVLKVLKQAHALFFENVDEDISNKDVRLMLKQVRKEILFD
ncbi:PREDICTED: RNA polymerase II C-terminal domain phosphatase-like 4 [Camelina sativa]|uniref:RNA polymerase II C-terminal domain phosphatase-like n=1 Tax=Camelina sativa TaxID=90675 RepID=A0ABM1RLD5_CAMSA|nr:PREDICTED: RNA polymerase II C-terminal domain phosphatase-like 4 [Camelina sativa]